VKRTEKTKQNAREGNAKYAKKTGNAPKKNSGESAGSRMIWRFSENLIQ
jgi:hypothetical protein